MPFDDRADAGRRLADVLIHHRGPDVVVLALPRGGVSVAFEVARALGAPMDLLFVRKLGLPFEPELAMGAIGEGGVRVLNESVLRAASVMEDELARVEQAERTEMDRRAARFRGRAPRVALGGRVAIVVDDGIATGSTARAACQVARAAGARRVVLATPVAPATSLAELRNDADEIVCLETPARFFAIGQFYGDFSQTDDTEVVRLLESSRASTTLPLAPPTCAPGSPDASASSQGAPAPAETEADVQVVAGKVALDGHLFLPVGAPGVVLFAHGSGSGRHSSRNRFVARVLQGGGLGTLLFDLLTPEEQTDRENRFDVRLLAERLEEASAWLRATTDATLPVAYFGTSTGAAAALWAAAEPGAEVAAVVSRGGRPDLAAARLHAVRAPTLLVVGSRDLAVLQLNRKAARLLACEHSLCVVPNAGHFFEEPGTLQVAAELARDWFLQHLSRR